jgi:hypothetical protein
VEYLKGILSGVAAVFLALCVPGLVTTLRGISEEKATGLAVVVAGLTEALFSPTFWIVTAMFFGLFFAAGRFQSRVFRVLLFWIPTVAIVTLVVGGAGLLAYLFLHSKRG